jgi:hypothetical protein
MLTFVESISIAGDREKQNDDACGATGPRAWVIDGATDLHDQPLMAAASDASWLAQHLNRRLYEAFGNNWGDEIARLSAQAASAFRSLVRAPYERWQSPIASMLMISTHGNEIIGGDLGDCRLVALGADGAVHVHGGAPDAADDESERAAQQTDAHKPLLERTETIALLRRQRAAINRPGAEWTFGLDPECAKHLRFWRFKVQSPAHLLLMTDGFSALMDRYRVYDAEGLVRAALDKGLQELGCELRAIETEDASGARHPRFKASDDATALLMRWSWPG